MPEHLLRSNAGIVGWIGIEVGLKRKFITAMQTFKTDHTLFLKNELLSWLWTFLFAATLYFGFKFFSNLSDSKLILPVVVIFLLKLSDTFIQYHVAEIRIDREKGQLIFLLESIFSGEKVKTYELAQATSQLTIKTGFASYFDSPFILEIFLKPKEKFRLNGRYGFSQKVLEAIDDTLKSGNENHNKNL